jgi:prepilin-type N-terminal cleavage/methylation domain-containing protein
MMKKSRESRGGSQGPESNTRRGADSGSRLSMLDSRRENAFTLIEIMVVVGIMAVILSMGIPSIYKAMKKEGMRKATSDVAEVCSLARARAILGGSPVDVVFYPLEGRLEIGGGGGDASAAPPTVSAGTSSGAQIDQDITIEMLDVNLLEYRESEWVRVRFYPNGTSDEMTLILRSSKNEWKQVTLEVTTGLASVDDVVR